MIKMKCKHNIWEKCTNPKRNDTTCVANIRDCDYEDPYPDDYNNINVEISKPIFLVYGKNDFELDTLLKIFGDYNEAELFYKEDMSTRYIKIQNLILKRGKF